MSFRICESQTYEMWVITFYSNSATAVSPAGHAMFGAKGPENFWLFKKILSRLAETVTFL